MGKWEAWTMADDRTARRMQEEGCTLSAIGQKINRNRGLISRKLRLPPMTSEGSKRSYVHTNGSSVIVPARVLEERDHRLGLAPRDLTAAIAGDPLPGMSALERRHGR
jgi:hypothetical protein